MSNFVLKYLNPVDHFALYYDNNIRPDNRVLNEYREIKVQENCFKSASGCFGSASVQIGDTAVTCGINYSVGTPDVLSPSSGEVRVNVTLGSAASSSVSFVSDTQVQSRGLQKSDGEHELETFLQNILISSKLIDVYALLIQKGQYAFRLEIMVFAVMKALQDTRVPVVEVDVSRQESASVNANIQLAEGNVIVILIRVCCRLPSCGISYDTN